MPTAQEKKALLFLSLLALLGTGVRAARAIRAAPPPDPAARAALRGQIAAVDSARARAGGRRQPGARRSSRGRSARSGNRDAGRGERVPSGVRVGEQMSPTPTRPPAAGTRQLPTPGPVDLDRASADEIERLPYVGPVLARRIVADRDSAGPFGSLEGLQRVRGVGPALARKLAPNVTFSLSPRQSRVKEGGRRPSPVGGRRARRPRSP